MKTKDFTDQTLIANAPRPLAEKYDRSKIKASWLEKYKNGQKWSKIGQHD